MTETKHHEHESIDEIIQRPRSRRTWWNWVFRDAVLGLSDTVRQVKKNLKKELQLLVQSLRLVFGVVFLVVGLFNFSAGRFCDGNPTSYYSCTNPATFYYFSWWAILLVIVGCLLFVNHRTSQKD